MTNPHDLARKFLATDGLKLKDAQKTAVFLFADWLAANDPENKAKLRHEENLKRIAFLEAQLNMQEID